MRISRRPRDFGILLFLFLALSGVAGALERDIPLTYYGEIGCAHCDTFVEEELPELTERYGVTFSVKTRDILSSEGYAECRERLAAMDWARFASNRRGGLACVTGRTHSPRGRGVLIPGRAPMVQMRVEKPLYLLSRRSFERLPLKDHST